jgi:hypothetical protein
MKDLPQGWREELADEARETLVGLPKHLRPGRERPEYVEPSHPGGEHSDWPKDDATLTTASQEIALLREMARRCHNGAPDPYQEFYDLGMSPLLERLADALDPA